MKSSMEMKKTKINHKFIPGKTIIPVGSKVFNQEEINNAIKVARNGWWTEGEFSEKFELNFKKYLGVKYVALTNSGSSANLLAISALTSKVFKDKALKPGDEVITSLPAFPTTINPIIQNKCVPVFVDCDLKTFNANPASVEKAISNKTKAIIIAHSMGNPADISRIKEIAMKNNLWLIEDCCDALGSKYDKRFVGTFADISTFSFYASHHMTIGEGGAVVTNNPQIYEAVIQFRDWGRQFKLSAENDIPVKARFELKLGKLPAGYDSRFIYSQIGYNLKITDFQAAIGVAQLRKLPEFIKKRKRNFDNLCAFFNDYKKFVILPEWQKKSEPNWFGFSLMLKKHCPFTRTEIVKYLESKKIATRGPLGGNLLRQPAYEDIKYRIIGNLKNSDYITNNSFWIGIHPGINRDMLHYIQMTFKNYFKKFQIL